MKKTILITGGTGSIGSHTIVYLLNPGYQVAVLDNLCNTNRSVTKAKPFAMRSPDAPAISWNM